jgi:hypothetical protein
MIIWPTCCSRVSELKSGLGEAANKLVEDLGNMVAPNARPERRRKARRE